MSVSMSDSPLVGVVIGSPSDRAIADKVREALSGLHVPCEVRVLSAHRTPDLTAAYAREAEGRGLRVLVACAGMAAHLAGVIAAHTVLPVIGVPVASGALAGVDALLATVQMPPGVPVGTLGVGSWGVRNAAHLALRILALSDAPLARRLEDHASAMAAGGRKR